MPAPTRKYTPTRPPPDEWERRQDDIARMLPVLMGLAFALGVAIGAGARWADWLSRVTS